MLRTVAPAALCAAVALGQATTEKHCATTPGCQDEGDRSVMERGMRLKQADWDRCYEEGECGVERASIHGSALPCVDGMAGEYPCDKVDLLSFTSLSDMGSRHNGNDIWGWVDEEGNEIALACDTTGLTFVDVTDPVNPIVLARVDSNYAGTCSWRDVKLYDDIAYIIADCGNHGVQVFDMLRLADIRDRHTGELEIVEPDLLYMEHGASHNIAINEETGFAYSIGSRTCRGGPHVIDLKNVRQSNGELRMPEFSGCFDSDGYTHDAQCVIYRGPDSRYRGREICFGYNENTLTILDVTDKDNMVMLSRTGYQGVAYTHQGWLTEDERYLLLDDELDEMYGTVADGFTRTYIWDVADLENPVNTGRHVSPVTSVDHNLYILGDYAYASQYTTGLRVLDVSDLGSQSGDVQIQSAFFDTHPEGNPVSFRGTWSNYPYFPSGNIILQDINRGLFVLRHNHNGTSTTNRWFQKSGGYARKHAVHALK